MRDHYGHNTRSVAILDASGLLTTVEDWEMALDRLRALSVFFAFAAVQIRQDRAVRKKGEAEVAAPSK